ncbi:MAG: cytochrome c3 family protein [Desulfosalsimonadaceae bacterium]
MDGRQVLSFLGMGGLIILATVITAASQGGISFVQDSAFENHMRPQVAFDHDAHNQKAEIFECNICHHMYENGKLLEGQASIGMECSACHQKTDKSPPMELISAYHRQCRGCHLRQGAGPFLCSQCHKKK